MARLTADVDVTVRAPTAPTDEWLSTLEGHGFARRFTDPAFIAQTRVVPVVHVPTGLPADQALGQSDLLSAFGRCETRARS